jgi:hypothetical protein
MSNLFSGATEGAGYSGFFWFLGDGPETAHPSRPSLASIKQKTVID